MPTLTGFTGKWTGPRSEPPPDWLPAAYIIRTTRTSPLMGITISHTCNRLPPLYDLLLFIHISIHMPVPNLHPQATRTVENASALQLAIDFYYANRNTITIEPHPRKNRSPSRIKKTGISIRRVAAMHSISYSQLRHTIAAGGELQTRSEAHEAEMTLTIAEEAALEEWCLMTNTNILACIGP